MNGDGFVVWLTGLQAAGKSTIASLVAGELSRRGIAVEVLDGDEVRSALSPGLGYDPAARDENTRRVAFVARLLARNGVAVLCPLVSPLRRHRDRCREWVPRFAEVHVKASIETVERRDPKGLYAKARAGLAADVVGIHQPYEEPAFPEVVCDTDAEPADASAARVLAFLEARAWIPAPPGSPRANAHGEIVGRLRRLGLVEWM